MSKKKKPTSTGEVKPSKQKKTAEQLLAEERKKDPKGMKKIDRIVEKAEKVVAKNQAKAIAKPVASNDADTSDLLGCIIESAKKDGMFVSTHRSGATVIRTKTKVLVHLQPTRKGITHYHYQKSKGFVAEKTKVNDTKSLNEFIIQLRKDAE